jgi:4-hydroxybenzoate polyprenyltransferase/phosphoserine phosphatase
MDAKATAMKRPLCVDMDGTLLATDVLWESLMLMLKTKPSAVLLLPVWLMRGKAYFKHQVAKQTVLNPAHLAYRHDVLSFLKEEKESGTNIILASASDKGVAEGIAHYLGIFSAVLGSDGKVNLAGRNKLNAIEKHVGAFGFDYMGNSFDDLPLWQSARRAILVHPSSRLLRRVRQFTPVQKILSPRTHDVSSLLKALRVHQWTKNILVFVPLIMAHKVFDPGSVLHCIQAFLSFSLCASSVYILNDLLDLEADRKHRSKRFRPFAAGLLQIKTGVCMVPVLIACAAVIAVGFLPTAFTTALALYLLLSTAYSFYLKRVLILDVLLLAGLYTIRVLAGALAISVTISPWLLAFAMFVFLGLAFLKRCSELIMMVATNATHYSGRAYVNGDVDLLRSVGTSSGYLSVLVLALYINSSEVSQLYKHPAILWGIGPCLLYWLTRMWFLAHRGEMRDDPIVFAVKDVNSYVVGVIIALVIVLAAL